MVVFNPETNPGQFGLNNDEVRIAMYGLEALTCGMDCAPADLDELQEWGKARTLQLREILGTVSPTDSNIIALQALQAEITRHFEEYGTTVLHPHWLPESAAQAVSSALAAGVELCDKVSQTSTSEFMRQRGSRERNNPVAKNAIKQLKVLVD